VCRGLETPATETIEEDPRVHVDDQDPRVPPTGDASPGPVDEAPDESTGDAGVDEALGRLDELGGLPVRDHVPVYDAIHAALQDRLADVED